MNSARRWIPLLILAIFLGALVWAKSRDPFERIEFRLKVPGQASARGMVVLPKPVRACPVVVYLHGWTGSLLADGVELRQLAELGLAAVGLEYDQTNEINFDTQFQALLGYLKQQPWAMSNATAWVGFSMGAQRTLSFVLKHPDQQPQLLVRLAGGWVAELDAQVSNAAPARVFHCPVLLVHGEADGTFPVKDVHRLAELLRSQGNLVNVRILANRNHVLEPDRSLVIRLVGEYCRSVLPPMQPFAGVVERSPIPFWVCLAPACAIAVFWFYLGRRKARLEPATMQSPFTRWEKGLRWLAWGLAALAMGETVFHLLTPQLPISETTLNIARNWLVPVQCRQEFDLLTSSNSIASSLPVEPHAVAKPPDRSAESLKIRELVPAQSVLPTPFALWQGKSLRSLLDYAELANYNRGLVNWTVNDAIYREYVLSPWIDTRSTGELNWRRPLWESFYPRIRKEENPEAAAQIVVRHLRERVTISSEPVLAPGITSLWQRQIADERGFSVLYVAALRSVGIGAKLNPFGKVEFWTGDRWLEAPGPIMTNAFGP